MTTNGRGLRYFFDIMQLLINKFQKKSQVVAMPEFETPPALQHQDNLNLTSKALLKDLEKTSTRYGDQLNINKDDTLKSPSLKESTDNVNQLMLSSQDLKNCQGGDESLRR